MIFLPDLASNWDMKRQCPEIHCQSTSIIKYGSFHRTSDGRNIPKFKCKSCKHIFSAATGKPEYYQKKRHLNFEIIKLLSSGMSRRRTAMKLCVSPSTVDTKLRFNSMVCQIKNQTLLSQLAPCHDVQFDELETFEHTKCKPISVAMAVQKDTRLILGFEVSQMPCKGRLAKKSRARYGPRKDHRLVGLRSLFEQIKPMLASGVHLMSDTCPNYAPMVRRMFKDLDHSYTQVLGGRGCSTGQGELKKLPFDPLFSLNHTFAMLRYGISRLIRRTWCTTKKLENLGHHLQIYQYYHNLLLAQRSSPDEVDQYRKRSRETRCDVV